MHRFKLIILNLLILVIHPITVQADTNSKTLSDAINEIGANVIFMRHALAPGYGDPANFKIDQCSTQRNLDHTGRMQAQRIGKYFKDHDINFDTILSSQWCRCKDTAQELMLGEWESFAGLNSFFQDHADRTLTLALLNTKMKTIDENHLVLMVTHQVVISAVTGHSTKSGGLVLFNTSSGASMPFSTPD